MLNLTMGIYYVIQHGFAGTGRGSITMPHDASAGVPAWFWLAAGACFLYFGMRVYMAIQNDKKH